MTFKFLEVTEPEQLDKIFRFRYEILCEELQFMDTKNYPDKKEIDQYDPYSIQFAAFDDNNEVVACVRLIHDSPVGYPTENNMKFDIDKNIFERSKLGEMSRIFVAAEHRNIQTTKIVIDHVKEFMYLKMKERGIEYTYGALEKSFIRLLKIYKMGYEIIGELQEYGNMRYPTILYTKKLGDDNPDIHQLWKEHNGQKEFRQAI